MRLVDDTIIAREKLTNYLLKWRPVQIPLYSLVSILIDVPKHNLRAGDIATIVEYLQPNGNLPSGYVCEASNAIGETIAVFSVRAEQVSPLHRNEVLHVRALATA